MGTTDRLVSFFIKFPGIGLRQARRFVYFLLSEDQERVDEFISLLQKLKAEIRQCAMCYRFFEEEKKEVEICLLCAKNRNSTVLIVVEKDIELENIQKGDAYSGVYFVLGGLFSPLTKESPARIKELIERVRTGVSQKKLKEVIVALSAHPNGDYTTIHIKNALAPLSKKYGLKISTLGRGMSTGSELEYSDAETIKYALANRK